MNHTKIDLSSDSKGRLQKGIQHQNSELSAEDMKLPRLTLTGDQIEENFGEQVHLFNDRGARPLQDVQRKVHELRLNAPKVRPLETLVANEIEGGKLMGLLGSQNEAPRVNGRKRSNHQEAQPGASAAGKGSE